MPLLDLFWAMMWFFLWIVWLWLLFAIFGDIFRSRDLSGWGKAGWTILIVLLPYVGVCIYLIARGREMADRSEQAQRDADYGWRTHGFDVPSAAEELATLARLRESGALTEDEFRVGKGKILAA